MLANERLDQIQVKVLRAKTHFDALVSEVHSYLASRPYAFSARRDAESRRLIYFVSKVQPTPVNISAILGDLIQNLRSALDHLAYQLVSIGTGKMPSNRIYFPIADDAKQYAKSSRQQIKGANPQAISAIDALMPFKGGNDTLWKLHKLNNVDKHRVLITAGSAFHSVDLISFSLREMQRQAPSWLKEFDTKPFATFFAPDDRMFPLKVGDELLKTPPDAEVDEKLEFRFDIAIGERGIIDGEPILEAVKPMIDLVERIVLSFESMLS